MRLQPLRRDEVDLLARGAVDVEGIVDETFDFGTLERALEVSHDPAVVKTVVTM